MILLLLLLALASTEPSHPVDHGLEWLARQQNEDGSWYGTEYLSDQAATGLVLLAYLRGGQTHKHGPHRMTVKRGLKWLAAGQDEDGCLVSGGWHPVRDHAIATLALCGDYALTGSPLQRRAAEPAVRHLETLRTPGLAWGDLETTTWALDALWTWRAAGNGALDPDVVAGVRAFLARSKRKDLRSVAMTAWILVCTADETFPFGDTEIDKRLAVLERNLPDRRKGGAGVDLLYWHFGTKVWERAASGRLRGEWRRRVREAICASRGRARVWEQTGPWGRAAGRTAVTALMVWTLEVVYYECYVMRPR